eukprot:757793-Hanusia_phi.AAC.1
MPVETVDRKALGAINLPIRPTFDETADCENWLTMEAGKQRKAQIGRNADTSVAKTNSLANNMIRRKQDKAEDNNK